MFYWLTKPFFIEDMNKGLKLFLAILIAAGLTAPMALANNKLTVADGTDLSYSSPINFIWVDTKGTQTQVIYSAALLADMRDEPINSVKFYLQSGCVGGWDDSVCLWSLCDGIDTGGNHIAGIRRDRNQRHVWRALYVPWRQPRHRDRRRGKDRL